MCAADEYWGAVFTLSLHSREFEFHVSHDILNSALIKNENSNSKFSFKNCNEI